MFLVDAARGVVAKLPADRRAREPAIEALSLSACGPQILNDIDDTGFSV